MKVMINRCFGVFSLSRKAAERLRDRGHPLATEELADPELGIGILHDSWLHFVDRADTMVIAVVEELGEEADGMCAQLKVVEIPDGVEWEIENHDGMELVAEKHRTWR